MKLQLFLLILLGLCSCGHIYVSDSQLLYQNTQYLTSAQLYFKLENELHVSEVLKIVWPYTFNVTSGTVTMSIFSTSSTTALTTGAATTDTSTKSFLLRMKTKLNAQQWYILNISTEAAQSPTAQYYTTPIQMSTHSGMTDGGIVTNYLMYDYNSACGFIAVAPAPGAISSVVFSGTETGTALPSNIIENKYFDTNYPVYITILPASDYEYGGTFKFTLSGGFKWFGSCEALSKSCSDDSACTSIQSLAQSTDYTCSVSDTLLTFKRFQNSTKLSINHQDYMRIKVQVKNPSIVATGGVSVQLVSNYANYIYEVLEKNTQFSTTQISLGTDNALYLWGLTRNLAANKGCPIRVYFTKNAAGSFAVWNKISLPFYPYLTLPESTEGFKIQVNVKAVSIINDLSIYTDASAFGSATVTCVTDDSSTDKYIYCSNVGRLTSNQTKYVKFSFIADADDYDATEFASFGQIVIYNQELNVAVTTSVTPRNLVDSQKNNVAYSADSGNQVYDTAGGLTNGFTPAATYNAIIARGNDDTTGRSSIKYTSDETNLFFPIITTFPIQCCAGSTTNDKYDCPESTNAECADVSGAADNTWADSIILKMLANKNAISLSSSDLDTSVTAETNVYQGVELYPSDDSIKGMFGMDLLVDADSVETQLCLADKGDTDIKICSTYSNYVDYTDAKSTSGSLYLYNQWFSTSDGYELHTVCYAGHAAFKLNVCGATINAATKGVMIRNVKLSVVANTLYPQQTELDFVMCFRYANSTSTSLGKDDTTNLATASLINAQVINFRAAASEVISSSGTMFRVGVLNYFTEALTTDNAVNYVPTLLRVGGYMQSTEVTTNNGIAFFFDGDKIVISGSSLTSTMPLMPTDCASPIVSGTVCRYFQVKTVNTNTPAADDLHKDYYPGLNAIIIGGSAVSAVTEFNYYIPVWIKAPAFSYAFIGLINNYATFPTVSSVYKIYGNVEITYTAANAWKSYAPADATSLTQSSLWGDQSTTGTDADMLNSEGDWELEGATIGALNTHDDGTLLKKDDNADKLAYYTSSSIYPGDTATQAVIDASFDADSTATDKINDDTTEMATAELTYAASMHFVVHSQIKYWSGDLTWSLTNTGNVFQGRCADMSISSYYDSTHNTTSYLIICPYEGTMTTTTTLINANPTLTIGSWTWPDYYGESAYIGIHLRYLWTDKLGNLKAYLAEKKQGSKRLDCTLGSATSIFSLQTNQKKAQLAITPLNSVVLLKATDTPKEKEKLLINVLVNTSTSGTLATTKCSCGLSSIKCSVEKNTNTFGFTLQNTDTTNTQTISNSQITLTFWLTSTSSTEESLEYEVDIYSYFYKKYATEEEATAILINDCTSEQTWTSTTKEDRNITVLEPNRDILVAGARTSFSFSFTSTYTILDISKFTINLAFLATTNSNLVSNLRCAIYVGSSISHLFNTFSYSTLTAVEFEYKQQDTTLDKVTELGNVNYKFQCDGGEVISTAPTSSSKIYVQNIISNTIAEGYGADQSSNYGSLNSFSSSSIANVSMAKTFDLAGQDSTYTFNVKVAAKTQTSATNVTTTTIRFKAGSYFYVEFARDISPRFNKLGIIRCYHESYPTYCKYESERRIAFIARTDLSHNQTYGHNFSIVGVQRPFEFQNYKKLYVALVPYLSTFNSLEFQDSTTLEDAATTDQSAITLPVVYYSQGSSTAIRSTFTMTMHIKFPSSTISENIPIWVDFPEDFDEAMFLGWSPSCQFKNVKINDNDTINNYANSCALDSNRRVKLNMSTDSNNTDVKLYALTISGIPTYNYEQYHTNAPIVWFGNSTSQQVPIYKTNLGYFNGTYNLQAFTFTDSATKQLLTWDSNIPECYIGTYRCTASLKVLNSENFFYDIGSFVSAGTYADLFSFNPAKLALETGKAYKKFEIAPKASAAPGLYQLKWTHEVTTFYSLIPPLFIIALNSQTEIAAESTSYDVPDGGKSLPIIFDFAGKMPENDVSITGAAKSLEINGTTYITSKYVSFKESQKTLTYSESYTSSQIQFVVEGKTVPGTNEPDIPAAVLSWTLSGTNSKAYKTPSDVTVNVVSAQEGTPELTLTTIETSNCVGYQTITAQCSHAGTLYYVVSQDYTATQIEFSAIKTASEDASIQETEIGTVYTNPKRTFFGYYLATNAKIDYTITISGKLQSEATHYLRMYCVNQMETGSVASDATWKQSSNGGKPLISAMKFESTNTTNGTQYVSLTIAQKKEVACIICKQAKVEKDKVFGTDGIACAEEGSVQTANATNTTQRLLETTTNATEYYVVMPDLFVASGSLDTVKTTLESSTFSAALSSSTALTGVALNSITCSINSAYPATPLINSPSVSPAENSITFTWTGANNTDGFVFVGVVQYTNATVEPTALQLKKNSGYTFDAFNKAFYYKDTTVSVTASPATKCLDYKYYWAATNEDPDTYQYTTGIKSGTTKTIGCPTFASMLSQSVLLIALIFLMIFA